MSALKALVGLLLVSVASGQQCNVPGFCIGVSLEALPTETLEDCLLLCQSVTGCEWYTYDTADNFCSVNADCEILDTSCETCLSGENECSPIQCNVPGECTGVILGQFQTSDNDACKAQCQANSLCEYYTFFSASGFCSLYNTCEIVVGICNDCTTSQRACEEVVIPAEPGKIIFVAGVDADAEAELVNLPSAIEAGLDTTCRDVPQYGLLVDGNFAFVEDDMIVGCGGRGQVSNDPHLECYKYQPIGQFWDNSNVGWMNDERGFSGHVRTSLGYWVSGGIGFSSNPGDAFISTEIYDSAAGQWLYASDMPEPRYGHCVVDLGGDRYLVAGGQNGQSGLLSETYIYDLNNDLWTQQGDIGQPRFSPACGRLPGTNTVIYVGGDLQSGLQATVEEFNMVDGTWSTTGRDPLFPNPGATLVPDGDTLIYAPGQDSRLQRLNSDGEWEVLASQNTQRGRQWAGVVAAPDAAFSECA